MYYKYFKGYTNTDIVNSTALQYKTKLFLLAIDERLKHGPIWQCNTLTSTYGGNILV